MMGEIINPNSKGQKSILCPVKETQVYPWVCVEKCDYYERGKCPHDAYRGQFRGANPDPTLTLRKERTSFKTPL